MVSHGADGYGAWLPLSGTSGTATRFDNGSTDTSQAANAQVAIGGGLTPLTSGNFVSFARKAATATFDDSVVYKSNLYTLNTLPTSAQVYPAITPPSNGTYNNPQTLTFTITYASNVTVNTANGTPRLVLSALGTGSIGTSNKAYATYQSGSGTTALTFSYTVQVSDSAPTSGLTMYAYIDPNGGTISGGSTCFTAPGLTGVLIGNSGYYRTVTIDHTKVGTVGNTNQTNFPVLFSGTYSYLATTANGGQVTNANGYDITFTSDAAGHTLLPFERESYNATTGAVNFWVQVPTASHSADTVIYLQYGNPNITTDQSNITGTWDSNYLAVYHLKEDPSGSAPQMKDSTSNANNGTSQNMVAGNQVAGKVAGSLNFDGSTTYVDVGTGGSVKGLTQYTISAWGKPAVLDSTKRPIYGEVTPSSGKARAKLLINSTNNFSLEGRANDTDSNTVWVQNATTLSTGTWYYVSAVFDSTSSTNNMHLMVNGVDQTNSISASTISNTTPALSNQIGKTPGSTTEHWDGIIDELRISKTARSADWNKTDYNSENAPDKATYGASGFYTVGSQTSR